MANKIKPYNLKRRLRKTLEKFVLAAAIALTPATAKAGNDIEKFNTQFAPAHIQWSMDHKDEARALVFGTNILFNCAKAGVISYINKNSPIRGCAKGALAGTIMSTGEYIATFAGTPTGEIKTTTKGNPLLGAIGKLTNDLGASIADNVIRNEDMLSQYKTELGPLTLTFKGSIIPHPSFTITPLVGIISNIAQKNKLDYKLSMAYLTPVFKINLLDMKGNIGVDTGEMQVYYAGYTTGNVMTYAPDATIGRKHQNIALTHELNHTLFWSRMRSCDKLLYPIPYAKQVEKWWNAGQDLCMLLEAGPATINKKLYYYTPSEIEAYIMERQ